METPKTICALCQRVGPLENSHILPKFTLARGRRAGDKSLSISAKGGEVKKEWYKDDLWEPLLCKECEGKFSAWEDRVARDLNQRKVFDFPKNKAQEFWFVPVKGLDYRTWKLFLMSLLWRMSVAQGKRWKHIKLPTHREEQLRKMLLADDSGPVGLFPCVLSVPYSTEAEETRMRVHFGPNNTTLHGMPMVSLVIDGLHLRFPNGEHRKTRRFPLSVLYLQEDGSIFIQCAHIKDVSYLQGALKRLGITKEDGGPEEPKK